MVKKQEEPKNIIIKSNLRKPKEDMVSIAIMAANAAEAINQIRGQLLEPFPRKLPPTFNTQQVAAMCDKTRVQYKNAENSSGAKLGAVLPGEKDKTYTLEEAIAAVHLFGTPANKLELGKVLVIANYKGGVGKTTTTLSLAQGLTLRGLKILVIDADPQSSATTMFGISPQLEVEEDQTLHDFIKYPDSVHLKSAIQKTYWHNLDLIAGASFVLSADIILGADQVTKRDYNLWKVMAKGIEPLKNDYDIILIDTGPNLGYLTQSILFSADAIICPCPLDSLDLCSLVSFWGLFMDFANFEPADMSNKTYDFVSVFISKAKMEKEQLATSNIIKGWVMQAFGDKVWDITLPTSEIVKTYAAQMQTIYDISDKKEMAKQSYRRYKEPMEKLVDYILSGFDMIKGG